ncbi:hypothetical protein AVEN_167427-1 [Araneus ventricosus]|uniref:Uncharacterized protein n=1 Tax=Araneus ventricosus TaxID=182803 RepID=A0A4Y2EPV4_ARAVE|nr:hypothetical protein AVEN_167427-1 [Araneus ventricosus]
MDFILVRVGRLCWVCNWEGSSFSYQDFKQANPPLIIPPANFDLEDTVSIVSDPHPLAEPIYTDGSHLEGETDSWSRESILFATGHGPFPSYPYRFRLHHSDIFECGKKGDPLHNATSCHMTFSYHFTKSNAENTHLWWKSLLSNKLSRINIAKLISFLTENENLIKQPPDASSSSDSDPDLSSSPRPQTYELRPCRGSIPRTLISHLTSI